MRLLVAFLIISFAFALFLPPILELILGLLFGQPSRETTLTNPINAIAVFSFSLLTIVEFVAIFVNSKASWKTCASTFFLLVMVLTSTDALQFLSLLNPNIQISETLLDGFSYLNFLAFIAFCILMIVFVRGFYPDESVDVLFPSSISALISSALLFPTLTAFDLQVIALILAGVGVFAFFGGFYVYHVKKGTISLNYIAIGLIPALAWNMEFAQISEICRFSFFYTYHGLSVISLFVSVAYLLIYLDFLAKTTSEARKRGESEARVRELQANILKNQVDPHFIFNALNVVKSLYMVDPKKGERALDLLSKNLRSYTKAANQILVPLETELSIISDYVELESMKYPKPIEVIYDIEDFNFKVPVFSLEPLVENSCRYSGIVSKSDGYIEIAAYSVDGGWEITVSDNGKGFDFKKVGIDSYGLKNVKERFELLLNATFEVDSKPGEGVRISIFIPNQEGGEGK